MTVSLSFDHGVTDGVPAAVFLRALGEFMAQPDNFGDADANN